MQNRHVAFHDLGAVDYAEAWTLQKQFLQTAVDIKLANRQGADAPTPNHLLFCEHPPVFTLGRNGDPANLLAAEAELTARGVQFFPIERGGDITYHGPGQLVGYPIFDLENFFTDLHKYLRAIENALIAAIGHYGLTGGVIDGLTGVWVGVDGPDPRKIAAIGIKCSRWVTMHGFALNVNTDLSYFDLIVPCGIRDKGVTSLAQELGRPVDFAEVKVLVKQALATQFGYVYTLD